MHQCLTMSLILWWSLETSSVYVFVGSFLPDESALKTKEMNDDSKRNSSADLHLYEYRNIVQGETHKTS